MKLALAVLLTLAAADPDLPAGYSCEDVRRIVAEHGKAEAVAWALRQGLSIRQILLIRKACRV